MRRTPRPTRTATLVPDTTVFRSEHVVVAVQARRGVCGRGARHEAVASGGQRSLGGDGCEITRRADREPQRAVDRVEAEPTGPVAEREHDSAGRLLHVDVDSSEEHTSELQALMRISYALFCLTKKNTHYTTH